jgi:hypothetical protein
MTFIMAPGLDFYRDMRRRSSACGIEGSVFPALDGLLHRADARHNITARQHRLTGLCLWLLLFNPVSQLGKSVCALCQPTSIGT